MSRASQASKPARQQAKLPRLFSANMHSTSWGNLARKNEREDFGDTGSGQNVPWLAPIVGG
ncbi:hypothetical protein IAQ61_011317 [Plenodomus lingam]|uniref:uncharacterized protein n=1 Tax=Leptosphaeria maculans TaxID=5022 RepID=UPI0033190F22|nr:hypothetical protein IAQ61_011317 [Plenodomus lingam]